MYQLLIDGEGNPVAEISLFDAARSSGEAVAGGTIVTPLETLLTQQVTVAVDGGEARRYPFTFCNQVGCFARIGLPPADLDRFKKRREAPPSDRAGRGAGPD